MNRHVLIFVSTVLTIGLLGGVVAGAPPGESTENAVLSTAAQDGSSVGIASPTSEDEPSPAGGEVPIELTMEGGSDTATVTLGTLDRTNVRFDATVRDADGDGEATVLFDTGDFGDSSDGFRAGSGTELVDTNSEYAEGLSSRGLADGSYDLIVSSGEQPHYVEGSAATDRSVVKLVDEPVDDSPSVTVEGASDDGRPGVSAELSNLQAGQRVTIPVTENVEADDAATTLTDVSVTPNVATSATVDITTDTEPFSNASAAALANGTTGLGYLSVETDLDDAQINEAVFNFEVNRSALERANSTAEAVTLARYNNSESNWGQYETEIVGETEESVQFQTIADGFSEWAITAATPQFEVTDTELSGDSITLDNPVTVEATISNTGGASGTHEAVLTSEGEAVDSQSVSLESGASETIELTHTFGETGEYSLAVDGTAAGSVTVEAEGSTDESDSGSDSSDTDSNQETDNTDETGGDGSSESSDDSGPGFGVLTALAGLASAGYALRRQNRQ